MFLSEKIMGQTVVSYTLTEVTAFFQQNCLSVVRYSVGYASYLTKVLKTLLYRSVIIPFKHRVFFLFFFFSFFLVLFFFLSF